MSRRRHGAAVGSLAAVVVALLVPMLAAWLVGQVLRDRFTWSQFLFWVPAFMVFIAALACLAARRALRPNSRMRRPAVVLAGIALVAAGARSARWEFGWRPWAPAPATGEVVVSHWNPQWPGREALACGRALAPHLGDVCVLSNPGSITRTVVAGEWVPAGWHVADTGQFAVVSRHPITECELLAVDHPPGVGMVWVGWAVVDVDGFGPLRILSVDLPSNPRMARAASAAAVESVIARVLGDRVPDMVVGDVNATPGGMVTGALSRFGHAAPPWASYGWLCTFERPWPLLRIDAMLASNALAWRGYRALDLAIGEHRMQQGIVARAGRRAAVSASADR
jgi:hypothetical protein